MEHLTGNEPQQIGSVLGKSTILNDGSLSDEALRQRLRRRESVYRELCKARGQRYSNNRLENYIVSCPDQQQAVDNIREYIAEFEARQKAGQSVLLIGPCGTGKDHLMFVLARTAAANYASILWLNGSEMWMIFRNVMNNPGGRQHSRDLFSGDRFNSLLEGSEMDITKRLSQMDVLAISDVAPPGGALTDWQAEKLLQIIDRRYSLLLPTFVTLNVANREEAEFRMGAAVVDRLAHNALVVCCNWPSYRNKVPVAE